MLPADAATQAIAVRHTQGTSRAFLLIRDQESKVIGHGEFTQSVRGSRVTSTLALQFNDGSVDEETSHFTQGSVLHFVGDHHVQKGPTFPKSLDTTIDERGNVSDTTVKDGKTSTERKQVQLPPDLTNGMIGAAILNLPGKLDERKFSFIAPNSKGRIIQLRVTPERADAFRIAGSTVKVNVYRIHYELGGITGVVAPLVGKQPADAFVWLTSGVPSLVREQAALYEGGPMMSLELAGASFEHDSSETK